MSKHIVEKPSLSINERLARYKQKLLKKNEKIASKILLKGDVVALPTENAPPNVMSSIISPKTHDTASPLASSIINELHFPNSSKVRKSSGGRSRSHRHSCSGGPLSSLQRQSSSGDSNESKISVAATEKNEFEKQKTIAVAAAVAEAQEEILLLKSQLSQARNEVIDASKLIRELQQDKNESEEKATNCWDEVTAQHFTNSILQQKIEELELELSQCRFDTNEELRDKNRKHKLHIKKLKNENETYENQANDIIEQITEQMNSIQNAAMTRINNLEEQVLEESNKRESIEYELLSLQGQYQQLKQKLKQQQQQNEKQGNKIEIGRDRERDSVESSTSNSSDDDGCDGNDTE